MLPNRKLLLTCLVSLLFRVIPTSILYPKTRQTSGEQRKKFPHSTISPHTHQKTQSPDTSRKNPRRHVVCLVGALRINTIKYPESKFYYYDYCDSFTSRKFLLASKSQARRARRRESSSFGVSCCIRVWREYTWSSSGVLEYTRRPR